MLFRAPPVRIFKLLVVSIASARSTLTFRRKNDSG